MVIPCLKSGKKEGVCYQKNLHLRENPTLRPEEKIEGFCLFILIGIEAIPFYHENGYDALDPADGAYSPSGCDPHRCFSLVKIAGQQLQIATS
ncbi:MAG: hypothetical protein EHM38_02460 [Geobacteraceae bacterium]|nr:MAG: hypothetical protein EHM38_02460 [Geobacteraceae bacterium]